MVDGAKLLTTVEAAEYLQCSVVHLERVRVNGGGPRFARLARRLVRYRLADLEAYVASHVCEPDRERDSGDGA